MEFKPYKYQEYCINRIVTDSAVGLFLDMGLGKTVITLSAIRYLQIFGQVERVLIVAPKKVAEDTWKKESAKWDHTQCLDIEFCDGSIAQRNNTLQQRRDITVISRDNLAWLTDVYGAERWPFDMVVLDELTSFKNHATKRWKSLKKVRDKIKKIVGLTGTPAPKGLIDLWAQVWTLDKGERLGKYITYYRQQYFTQLAWDQFNYYPVDGAQEMIMSRISDLCISMKAEDYIDVPKLISNVIEVPLDTKDREAYKEFKREFVLELEDEDITAANAASLSQKLLQMCNGAVYNENKEIVPIHDAKIQALLNLVDDSNGKPLLVFYSFVSDRERITEALKKRKGYRVADIKDPGIIDEWNNGEIDMLLAHPASAAFGLNLQAGGHTIIWFGMQWSLELYQQAIGRLRRQGQKHSVIVNHLVVPDSMDVDVMKALEGRNVTQESIIASIKARIEEERH